MPPPTASLPHSAACLAACLAAMATGWGVFLVRGSTAVPAALWSVAACLAFAAEMGASAAGALSDPATAAAVRLAVVSLSLCPAMSLLGAKRPQHGVWQLIVATLAAVLAMPAASASLVRPGSFPDVHLLERCFMPLLVLGGWMNFVGTRRAVAATCVAVAQVLLLRAFLPGMATDAAMVATARGGVDLVAAGLLLVGTLVAAVQSVSHRGARSNATAAGCSVAAVVDPPFLALRETLGAAWSLRIVERFDTVATARGWPCRLGFSGLQGGGDAGDTAWQRDALRAFRALARRFVSEAWLIRHGWPSVERDSPGSL